MPSPTLWQEAIAAELHEAEESKVEEAEEASPVEDITRDGLPRFKLVCTRWVSSLVPCRLPGLRLNAICSGWLVRRGGYALRCRGTCLTSLLHRLLDCLIKANCLELWAYVFSLTCRLTAPVGRRKQQKWQKPSQMRRMKSSQTGLRSAGQVSRHTLAHFLCDC